MQIHSSPSVSILVPCFNAARWLPATLDSAISQTWQRCEVIVVDDGSTDNSLEVARSFEPRGVRVFSQPNSGASAARNRALREARGSVIQFLDADDLLSPDKIELQLALLAKVPNRFVASCAWGRFTHSPEVAQFLDSAVFRDFLPLDFLILAADIGAMMHPSAWLIPRDILDQAGPWNEKLSLNDDGEYFCRVLLASAGVSFCPDSRARTYYRSGMASSLSQQRGDRARRSQFLSIELIEGHVLAKENSQRTRRAIANMYQRYVHDFFPHPSDLIESAEQRVIALGGATLDSPLAGPKTAALCKLIGWKNVQRVKHFLGR